MAREGRPNTACTRRRSSYPDAPLVMRCRYASERTWDLIRQLIGVGWSHDTDR